MQEKEERNSSTGVLKMPQCSPIDRDLKPCVLSSPPYHLNSDISLSPSSPVQSNVPKITIVKLSADSIRQFSVVATVEEQRLIC